MRCKTKAMFALTPWKIFLMAFCAFPFPFFLKAQEVDRHYVTQYTSKNGLPQNSVKSMFMDANRFIWMTTESGLVRFDGHDFKLHNRTSLNGISNDRFQFIYHTWDRKLALTDDIDGNLVEISNSKVRLVHKVQKPRMSGYFIRGAAPDLPFLINAELENISGLREEETTPFIHVMPVDSDRYALTVQSGLAIYSKKASKITSRITTPTGSEVITAFMVDQNVYCIDEQRNCFRLSTDIRTLEPVALTGFDDLILDYRHMPWNYFHNQAYVTYDKHLYRIKVDGCPNALRAIKCLDNLADNVYVSDVFHDEKSGSYFVSTSTKGLFVYRRQSLKTILVTESENVLANCFYAQIEIDSNYVYAGWDMDVSIKGYRPSKYRLKRGASLFYFATKENNKRVLYSYGNLLRSLDLATNITDSISATSDIRFYGMAQIGDSVLVASSEGLYSVNGNQINKLTSLGLEGYNQRVSTIIKMDDDNIWLGHCDAIISFNPTTKQLTHLADMKGVSVRIIEKIGDLVLIGSYGQGFYAYHQGEFVRFPEDPSQKLSKTHSFLLDHNNLVWMSTNTGLVNVALQDLKNFLADSNATPYYYAYGIIDGIINNEFNGGCTPTHIRLKNGYVSYPTMEGLVWVKPEDVLRDVPNEKIFIDEVLLNGTQIPFNGTLNIPSYYDEVTVNFSTPYWGNIENLQVEYRIKGIWDDWRPTEGGGRWVDFANLDHGNYTLQIRNKLSGSNEHSVMLEIPVVVEPEFYQTKGFVLGSTISGLMLLWGLFRANSARVVRRNKFLENQVGMRTRDLQLSNDKLNGTIIDLKEKEYKLRESIRIKDKLISIISHDIITPIKFLSIVSKMSSKTLEEKSGDSKENMRYIGAAAEKIYNNASNILNWIKLQNDLISIHNQNVALYDFTEELISQYEDVIDEQLIRFENMIDEEAIIITDPNILKIVVQNLLANAIKYTKSGTISIASEMDGMGNFNISVSDTGSGMPEKILEKIKTIKRQTLAGEFDADDPDTGNQLGYFIIFDFARLLNGDVSIQSAIGIGTVVTLHLPPPPQ
ncbi:MAG: ATP-binding protein [Bacteroidia bacterium]